MPDWAIGLISILLSSVIGLQCWIIKQLITHEKQLYRLVSNAESEKGARARVHSDFETRLRKLEQHGRSNQR